MEENGTGKPSNYKSVIARKLIMFNALSCSRPRTELGQPVLYCRIREGINVEDEGVKKSWRKSIRTLSDPDIKASLIKADEQFFKNDPMDSVCEHQVQNSHDDSLSPRDRKSVKELLMNFELKTTKVKQQRTNCVAMKKTSAPPAINSLADKSSWMDKLPTLPRKEEKLAEPYEIVNIAISCESSGSSYVPNSTKNPYMSPTPKENKSLYYNSEVISGIPKNFSLDDREQGSEGLNFVEDHYGEPENEPATKDSVSSTIVNNSISRASSGYQSMSVHSDFSTLRDSAFGTSLSDVSDESDDEGWDSDEFDDSSDEDKANEGSFSPKVELTGVKKKLYNIVMEILTTERAYVKRLYLLEEVFYKRLLAEARENATIPEKVVNGIFPNLASIHTFHSTVLLPDLETRMKTWSEHEKIGDIFKSAAHFLKMYTFYVKNFDEATKTLNQWIKKSPKIAAIIEELQKLPECEHLTLQHHMLEPIQRVPRYKLLLQDYLKKLPEDSPDRAEAQESLNIISEAAVQANQSMKIMDVFNKLMEIQERIVEGLHGESLITASRRFIKEGEVTKIAARSDKRTVRVLLLFNDVVLCCSKIPAAKLKVKQVMDVDGMVLRDGSDIDLGDKFSFRIKSRQRILDVACTSEDAKEEWMMAISQAIDDFYEKRASILKTKKDSHSQAISKAGSVKVGAEAPFWIRDDDTIMCMLCASRFWFINRRHHCRGCGRIVCESCSKYKANLEYADNTTKRVCYVCFRKLRNVDDTSLEAKTELLRNDRLKRSSVASSVIDGELLWKQPGKGWNRGYFALSDLVLYMYKRKQDVKAFHTIPLPGYCVERSSQGEQGHPHAKNTFSLHKANIKEMTYCFQAETEDIMERWVDMLEYAVKAEQPPDECSPPADQ